MKYYLACVLILCSTAAFAQQPMPMPGQQPNQLETQLTQEWSAMQLAQQHFVTALTKIVEEARTTKMTLEMERKYWADYVKGSPPTSKP